MSREITGRTGLFCLIGSPVGHSGSPAMYNFSFEKRGLDYAYMAFDVKLEETEAAVQAMRTLGIKGFNITMPCKTETVKYIDELSDAAKLIGAVNTVVIEDDGRMIGHNTDGIGLVNSLAAEGVDVKGKKMVIMGDGGAATAVQVQCALSGASEILIFNRRKSYKSNGEITVEKIQSMVPGCKAWIGDIENKDALHQAIRECDILVNATKVGMKPMDDQSLVTDMTAFHPGLVVVDAVYNPAETKLIQDAKKAGVKLAAGGKGMLLYQAVTAFKLFTGEEMPVAEVKEKFFK